MAEKSKILIIGGTGYIGKYLVEASRKAGYPTYALVRESTASNPEKLELIGRFKSSGVSLIYGDIDNRESLVMAIKQVEVVISAVGPGQQSDQFKIIAAIKEAGNIKRFLPSEFGVDVDLTNAVEPAASLIRIKAKVRRATEAEGIPFTYVVSHGFAGYYLSNLGQIGAKVPLRDKITILGDGNTKVIILKEEDIATYTIKAVGDPRTLNKILYMSPPANIPSFNEIISLWERKIGSTLEKTYILEDELLKNIRESPFPINMILSVSHSAFVKGDHAANYDINASIGAEASELYPEVKYTTVDECLNLFV
ncbi:isoflavone reductase homolog A622-like isoform X1 [Syzygium oleosum]|uniref:isoflavone reductase homolog A622-like isoform X1 n=1 Tax=Syzygium oleosum TaxID=219896 RepID=UPI0011D1C07F|nr:isoflavone reductase homolog A622-like isoform X1 [Syzygium oleosum]